MISVTFNARRMVFCCVGALVCARAAEAESTLYQRLGGEPGVHAIAYTLIDRVSVDPVTGPSFKDSKLQRIQRLLAEQICELADGPCKYSGDPMKEVHAGHQISEAQFYRMVEILRDVLGERDVDTRSTNQLLRLLAPMKRDVVEHHGAAKAAAPGTAPAANPSPGTSHS